jgi:hypothetical protein
MTTKQKQIDAIQNAINENLHRVSKSDISDILKIDCKQIKEFVNNKNLVNKSMFTSTENTLLFYLLYHHNDQIEGFSYHVKNYENGLIDAFYFATFASLELKEIGINEPMEQLTECYKFYFLNYISTKKNIVIIEQIDHR